MVVCVCVDFVMCGCIGNFCTCFVLCSLLFGLLYLFLFVLSALV